MSRRNALLVALAAFVLGTLFGRFVWPTAEMFHPLNRSAPVALETSTQKDDVERPSKTGLQQDVERLDQRFVTFLKEGKLTTMIPETVCPTLLKSVAEQCVTPACVANRARFQRARAADPDAKAIDAAIRLAVRDSGEIAAALAKRAPMKGAKDKVEADINVALAPFECSIRCDPNAPARTCPIPCIFAEAERDYYAEDGGTPRAEQQTYLCPRYCQYCGEGPDKPVCTLECALACGDEVEPTITAEHDPEGWPDNSTTDGVNDNADEKK